VLFLFIFCFELLTLFLFFSSSLTVVVRKPARKARAVAAPVVEQEVIQEWVQCSTCEKWHELPQYIKPDSLPDEWYRF